MRIGSRRLKIHSDRHTKSWAKICVYRMQQEERSSFIIKDDRCLAFLRFCDERAPY